MYILIYHNQGKVPEVTLRACGRYSPSSPVVVLSEDTDDSKRLAKAYQHKCCCDHEFTLRSIKRWIIFRDYCHTHNLSTFHTFDSDVLLFCDVGEQAGFWADAQMSLMNPGPEQVSIGSAYFHELKPLEMFCDWVLALYEKRDRDSWHYVQQWPDIEDMLLWSVFLIRHPEVTKNFLDHPRNKKAFDANLQVFDGWDNDGASKKIQFKQGYPYGRYQGARVRMNCLHCWGIWKTRMEELWQKAVESGE